MKFYAIIYPKHVMVANGSALPDFETWYLSLYKIDFNLI
jgi:hypothetical protein